MAALPYMQLYVADYLADTQHLTAEQHGAYLLLIFNYWQRGESFKAKDERTLNERLANVARTSSDRWNEIKETLAEFFVVTEHEWSHRRIEDDLSSVLSKSSQASEAGKASGARRRANRDARENALNGRSTGVPTERERNVNHTDTDTDTDTDKKKKKGTSVEAVDMFSGIAPDVVRDFKKLRKSKKAAITQTAVDGIKREAVKAGVTLEQALRTCCERGWQSFKSDWVTNNHTTAQPVASVAAGRKL